MGAKIRPAPEVFSIVSFAVVFFWVSAGRLRAVREGTARRGTKGWSSLSSSSSIGGDSLLLFRAPCESRDSDSDSDSDAETNADSTLRASSEESEADFSDELDGRRADRRLVCRAAAMRVAQRTRRIRRSRSRWNGEGEGDGNGVACSGGFRGRHLSLLFLSLVTFFFLSDSRFLVAAADPTREKREKRPIQPRVNAR